MSWLADTHTGRMCGFRGALLLLHLTAVTGQINHITVRDGDDVTLSCTDVMPDQDQCSQTWGFINFRGKVTEFSRIVDYSDEKSDRRSVSANCSLVIEKVTASDAGRYFCRQRDGSGSAHEVILSVVTIYQHKNGKEETLTCSVSPPYQCRFSVKWEFAVKNVGFYITDYRNSSSRCLATMNFQPSRHFSSNYKILSCNVAHLRTGEVKNFHFSPYSSETQEGEEAKTTKIPKTTSGMDASGTQDTWYLLRNVIGSVGLAALLISVVTVTIWTRTKGNKTRTRGNTVHEDEGEADGTVQYENLGEPSVSVRFH